MQIIPYIGQEPVTASSVSISVDSDDRARAQSLVLRTHSIVAVSDNEGFLAAKRAAGELKGLLVEIEDSRKSAKRHFLAVERAIDSVAGEIGQPVSDEHKRVLGLLNGYVTRLEAAAKEEQKRKDEALAKQVAQQQAKLLVAQEARAKAEAQAREARDELAKAQAQEVIRLTAQAIEQAQLAAEMAKEISQIGEKAPKSLVPGGRVDHNWEFKLVSIEAVVKAGCWRLVRWELDKLSCADSCKLQLELAPNIEPSLPGIEVTRTTNVSVRASAKIN